MIKSLLATCIYLISDTLWCSLIRLFYVMNINAKFTLHTILLANNKQHITEKRYAYR